MRSKHVTTAVALVLAAAATVAATREAPSTSFSCATVMGSEVCTWVTMNGSTAEEIGASIPMALIEAVPEDAEMVWPPQELAVVPLPEAAQMVLGIDHLGINWEAHGHPPATFMVQHFDFHFYNLTQADVRAIDCSDNSKPAELPSGYALPDIDIPGMGVLVGLCVPRMGMHAMPERETEATDPFAASMMLGYYASRPVFFEPMVSRERLLQKSDFSLPMPHVADLPEGVRYPSEFRAVYDAEKAEYRLIFTGFRAG
jgi:hypothetical protein